MAPNKQLTCLLRSNTMNELNLTPLFRSSVGFDRIFDMMNGLDQRKETSYPPYNIEVISENQYQITMAIAGFSEENIDIQQEQSRLIISGQVAKNTESKSRKFLHKGIAERSFKQEFQLEDHVKVTKAALEHGILSVSLEREIPEAMKPRKIAISNSKTIDSSSSEHQKSA